MHTRFQRNQSKPVGGLAYTWYLILEGGRKYGRTDLWKDGMLNTMSPCFLGKEGGGG